MNWKKIGAVTAACVVPGGLVVIGMYLAITYCWHKTGNPITLKEWSKDKKEFTKATYVVCTKCGAQFDYDLTNMKRGAKRDRHSDLRTGR